MEHAKSCPVEPKTVNWKFHVCRQAGMLGPRAPEQCVFDCIETMDAKMTEAFPEVAGNSSDDDNMAGMILKSQQPYDAAKFEQFCE